ncbi:mercuric reductase [Thalassoglobus sp.]|uniref:mercuric reductase n=1 Tax=Thalassoglobus sp. TaxID=2795869 RepID=UPI003AA8DE10
MKNDFDVVWIGTGQATMTVVPRLAAAGKRVAIVERSSFGGTCVNTGCTPTKTLVASAHAIHLARRGREFGFSANGLTVDFSAAMETQQAARRRSSAGIKASLARLGTVFEGEASFQDDHTIQVGAELLEADTIVIHAGTRPVIPNVVGLEDVNYLTNETLLDLRELPSHLVIVGGSYIALEFAQIFRRFGSDVTVLEHGPRLVFREDEDISREVERILSEEGVRVVCNARVDRVDRSSSGVKMEVIIGGEPQTVAGSHLLLATGRIPNSDRLNTSAAGLKLTARGYIKVNELTQTNVSHIWAVGDINGKGAFTHTSVHDGEVFWDQFARQHGLSTDPPELDRTVSQRSVIYSMFIDPPLARVGLNETQARASGRNVLMAVSPMSRIARAREKRETNGLVKILVDADTEQVLGATIFGTGGDEVIGAFAVLMQAGLSWKQFRRVVFPHPTVSELMPWIMDGLKPLV